MAERSKAAVLKTVSPSGDVGSNPTPSAREKFELSLLALGMAQGLFTRLPAEIFREHEKETISRISAITSYICYGGPKPKLF